MVKKQKSKHWAKYRFEIIRKAKGAQKFHWRLISCNGRIVCHSEKFYAEDSPRKTINNLITAIKTGQYKIVGDIIHE